MTIAKLELEMIAAFVWNCLVCLWDEVSLENVTVAVANGDVTAPLDWAV